MIPTASVKAGVRTRQTVTRIHILADNTVGDVQPPGLYGEWGFAAHVDGVLLDTGQTGIARQNAHALGLDPAVETIVLSHGHWDHTGGLVSFLEARPTIYAHPEAFRPKYKEDRFIGLPFTRDRLEADADIVDHREPVEVADGITALGEIPRPHPDNPTGETTTDDGERIDDRVIDDQSLAVETDSGLALVLGCCHAGLMNTIEHAESVLDAPVTAVIGGTHLTAMTADEVDDLAESLAPKLDLIAPCHCTGREAERILRTELEAAFEPVGVGSSIEV